MRQYAEEKLEQANEVDDAHHDHMTYFAQLMFKATPYLKCEQQIEAHQEIMQDYVNLLGAWNYAVRQSHFQAIDAMMEGLNLNNYLVIDRYPLILLIDESLKHLQEPTNDYEIKVANRLLAWGLHWFADEKYATFLYGIVFAESELLNAGQIEKCIRIAQIANDSIALILCLIARGRQMIALVDLPDDYERALAIARQAQKPWYECLCLGAIISYYYFTRRVPNIKGDTYLSEFMTIASNTNNPDNMRLVYVFRSVAALDRGYVTDAIGSIQRSQSYLRLGNNEIKISFEKIKLGSCYIAIGEFDEAQQQITDAIKISNQFKRANNSYAMMLLAKIDALKVMREKV